MRLEVQYFRVEDIRFGGKTLFLKGILTINKREFIDFLVKDSEIKDMDIEIARPGERARITNVLDIYEPRVKEENGHYFPGMSGEPFPAGQGKTNVLKGTAVFEIGTMPGLFGGMLDMTDVGAALTHHSQTHNICLLTEPPPEMTAVEYCGALKQIGLKGAVYLAGTTLGMIPDEVRTFDLNRPDEQLHGLPKIGCLLQLHCHGDLRETFIYGDIGQNFYPTVLHPNEILDGAIVCGQYNIPMGMKNPTYTLLNHPIVSNLYERHGKELDFKGIVIAPEPTTLSEIRRTAMMSANLLKNCLGVDGVIITKEGGGHADIDLMQNCDACEKLGIKTVLLDYEWAGENGSGECPLLDYSPNANAMISVGNIDGLVDLPPMEKIIGGDTMFDAGDQLLESVRIPLRVIPDAISLAGLTRLTTEEY